MSAHFSFTNSLYDSCNLKKKEQESTGPFNWITDPIYEIKEACHVDASPFMQNEFNSIPPKFVDIENDLRNQTRRLSRCPSSRFDPTKVVNDNKFSSKLTKCKTDALNPQYTRINKPCNIFNGISINRFHPLCEDLQALNKIQSNDYIGMNTRLNVKDSFESTKVTPPTPPTNLLNLQPYRLS
jgi:hypothetical protein